MSEQNSNLISITIDGQEIACEPGTLVIRAAEQLGITIPRLIKKRFRSYFLINLLKSMFINYDFYSYLTQKFLK